MRTHASHLHFAVFAAVLLLSGLLTSQSPAQRYHWTNWAGKPGESGNADGTGCDARFSLPRSVAVDGSGNVYVADTYNHTIRKVPPAGIVTTLAGSAGNEGNDDGTGNSARFNRPSSIAVDGEGNVYVADTYNHTIRQVTPAGVVTTLAGSAGDHGSADGTGSAARFSSPSGVAVNGDGNVYVVESGNHAIRKVTLAGVVTTLAGSPGRNSGSANGTGSAARFGFPSGIAVDGDGNVYVADTHNHTIRKVTPIGVVTTIGGLAEVSGSADGMGSAARFRHPYGVVVDGNGNVYVADGGNQRISRGVLLPVNLPDVATIVVSGITQNSATSGGNVSSDGGDSVIKRGVVYATTSEPTMDTGIQVASGGGTGGFVSHLVGLSSGTTYYVRAYAINSAGTAYGEQVGFTTSADLPEVETTAASSITQNSATIDGNVSNDGNDSATERGVVYATTPEPTTETGTKITSGSGAGSFVSHLVGLSASTTYYVRAYAINSAGTAYGEQISFTTSVGLPDVATTAVSSITHNSAVSGGNVSSDGGGDVTERGVVYATTPEPTTETGTKITSGSGTGSFVSHLADLSASTTYYVRAYAINSAGTAYGEQVSFVTSAALPIAPQPYQLTITRNVPATLETTPDKAGTLVLKAVPAKNASKLTGGSIAQTSNVWPDTKVTVTATAKKGHLFSHWGGLPAGAQAVGNVVSFTMPNEDVSGLTAHFIANPFLMVGEGNPFAGLGSNVTFQGLLLPLAPVEPESNAEVGLLTATLVAAKGSLSGKVFFDGLTTSYTGVLQGDGSVWFKVGKGLSDKLPLKGIASRTLSATWSETGLQTKVNVAGSVVSEGLAKPKLATVPNNLLIAPKHKQGYYTLALFPSKEPASAEDAALYPQGVGYATLTLTKGGTLKLTGALADGTKITTSSVLVHGETSPIFLQLRTPGGKTSDKGGSFGGHLVFDREPSDTDVKGEGWWWFRPQAKTAASKTQAYRAGWANGIQVEVKGAMYDLTEKTVQELLGLDSINLEPTDLSAGNAALVFKAGKLAAEEGVKVKGFNIDDNKVVKRDKKNTSFTLSITAKTGLMKGTFTPVEGWVGTDGPLQPARKLPTFQGVLLSKQNVKVGFGFFLSNAQNDRAPESGAVTLEWP